MNPDITPIVNSIILHDKYSRHNGEYFTDIDGNVIIDNGELIINSDNVLIKDNLLILNSEAIPDKDIGILYNINGIDASTIFWNESLKRFIFATSKTTHDASKVIVTDFADAQLKNIYALNINASNITASNIDTNSSRTISVNLYDNSYTPVVFEGLKLRGVYHFQIESVLNGGAVYDYKLCKSKAESPIFTAFGIHQASIDNGEEVSIKWDSNSPPSIYHKTLKRNNNGSIITYKVRYTTVN